MCYLTCAAREAWRQARLRELLDVPYCNLVFTLPHQLNGLAAAQPRWVYETLLQMHGRHSDRICCQPPLAGGAAPSSPWCCTPGRRTCAATCTCMR